MKQLIAEEFNQVFLNLEYRSMSDIAQDSLYLRVGYHLLIEMYWSFDILIKMTIMEKIRDAKITLSKVYGTFSTEIY